MTFLASWARPNSLRNVLVDLVARAPGRVQTKLLIAFLTIAGLLIVVGAVGLSALSGVNEQTQQLIRLQREIAAYRQVQQDTTSQLYGIASALLFPDDPILNSALRQLNQFGYDLDRLEFVAETGSGTYRRGSRRVRPASQLGDAGGRARTGGAR